MSKSKISLTLLKLAPLFAFLFYGSWAAGVNFLVDSEGYFQSGLVQGLYALISTLILELSVLKIYSLMQKNTHAKLITYLISFCLMVTIPAMIQSINNTQEIFYSIVPGIIIGGIYLFMILRFQISK